MTQSNEKGKLNPILAALASLVIPGLGQMLSKKVWRGITFLAFALISSYLTYWSFAHFNVGQVQIGPWTTSWLWAPTILFWLWNGFDSYRLARGKSLSPMLAVLCAAIVLYVVAWNITDVNISRMVNNFGDMKAIATQLANPDYISTVKGGKTVVCGWSCLVDFVSNKIQGKPTAPIGPSENLGNIFGQKGKVDPPFWQIWLGMAKKGDRIPGTETGKLVETIAIGLMATLFSTIIAIPVSFLAAYNIMSRIPGGKPIYFVMRLILNFIRAIDTIVWGLIIIVWVGLGSFAGVIALTIHSIAALAKLFSEEIEHIDPGPVEAIEAAGGNFFQILRYGVIPQIVPPFLSYTLLRWDINMRSATVIGFVAGGGIGFFVVETIRQGAYQMYAAALWAVAVVIILVDAISSHWRNRILADQPQKTQKAHHKILRVVYIILGIIVFMYCWQITDINFKDLFHPGSNFGSIIRDFVTIDLSASVLNVVVKDLITTVMQAFLATTLGAIFAIPFSFLAAKNLTGNNPFTKVLFYVTRGLFNILRSIEALLYVAIFVFWVGIGPFAGMLALAITTFALLGKLFSESIETIDAGPIEALNAIGSNILQMIRFAILPQIIPPFISYLIYQWDINIRMATIIGFAGGGGIGMTLSTYFGSLQYHKAGTVVLAIVIIVAIMDFTSAKIREELV
ncbi:MAG: phosphonate ABC transporter, permease protein PhnE [Anaerolineaceae bacterium]|nr:phosphonate ABC transporter, permease protein PhnE [Anaerolineaceae bacterium]